MVKRPLEEWTHLEITHNDKYDILTSQKTIKRLLMCTYAQRLS